jgi:hypothetical protein
VSFPFPRGKINNHVKLRRRDIYSHYRGETNETSETLKNWQIKLPEIFGDLSSTGWDRVTESGNEDFIKKEFRYSIHAVFLQEIDFIY